MSISDEASVDRKLIRPKTPLPSVNRRAPSSSSRETPVPGEIMRLQRTAGNAAVTSMLMRQPAPAAAPTAAPPALWPGGPTTTRKSAAHTLEEYVGWVQEVEAAYPGRGNVVQRLRRLYYSDFVSTALKGHGQKPGAGSKFDEIIDTSGADQAPLQSPPISQAALDGLFETDNIITPPGAVVDVSHIWPDMDLAISGKTAKATAGWFALGAEFQGVLTWTGDLASWFVEFVDRIRKMTGRLRMPDASSWADLDKALGIDSHKLFSSLMGSKVSKDDLLGDLDAQALVAKNVTPGRVYGGTATANVSDMLLDYYKPAKRGAPELSRFAAFVRGARPEIPYTLDPTNAPSFIQLSSKAAGSMFYSITEAAEVLLSGTRGHNVTPADDLDFVIMEIAKRFRDFLTEGLLKGDAPWP